MIWVFCPCQWWVSKEKVWVGGVSSIQVFFFDFWNFVNFPKPRSDSCKLCVSRCDQISNRSGLMAWCHHNVGCYIPSESGIMGRGGGLYVVYYTKRHSVGTRVQYVQHSMSCTIQYETDRVHRHWLWIHLCPAWTDTYGILCVYVHVHVRMIVMELVLYNFSKLQMCWAYRTIMLVPTSKGRCIKMIIWYKTVWI